MQISDLEVYRKPRGEEEIQGGARGLTVEAIDGFLSHPSGDAAVDPLVLVALVLQEVLEQVQHLGHLQQNEDEKLTSLAFYFI